MHHTHTHTHIHTHAHTHAHTHTHTHTHAHTHAHAHTHTHTHAQRTICNSTVRDSSVRYGIDSANSGIKQDRDRDQS